MNNKLTFHSSFDVYIALLATCSNVNTIVHASRWMGKYPNSYQFSNTRSSLS